MSQDDFDYKNSLVYMNSTAALMETLFKNMKNEDFVYPAKKEVHADDGAIIRCEELIRRQAADKISFVIRDPYLESMLAKMSDEDFSYETQKKPVDPNYGRVVRALELMELAGTSKDEETKVEMKKVEVEKAEPVRAESVQKENVASPARQSPHTTKSGSNDQTMAQDNHSPSHGYGQKKFGGSFKKQNNKNRVKYDIQTWKNDRNSVGSDNSSYPARRQSDNYRVSNNHVYQKGNGSRTAYHVENLAFSPNNNGFNNNFGGPRHNNTNNGYGGSRGRGNRNGYNGQSNNNGQQQRDNVNYWNRNQGVSGGGSEFWNGQYNDNQMWK
ncbi:hypothetical protein L5515_016551 [Caenorhabditis briggsae]|uniref:Uncharacterized protein n=1 Tax=Caenorhabditis briggsae TaxID=6238 RepID=A0AAE9FEJ1_CAEBR|nr:hypothetical protein L5515_016551 [Caenorhabditis briggsae]